MFSEAQKIFIVESFFRNGNKIGGVWNYSMHDCFDEFRTEFPDVAVTFHNFRTGSQYLIDKFRQTGSVQHKKGAGRPTKRSNEVIEEARQIMENNPSTSIRHLSQQIQQTDLCYSTCQTLLKKDLHLYPYRVTAIHELLPNDVPQRLNFCEWFLNNFQEENSGAFEKTFFTDEAYFYLSGYVNSQNMRMWNTQNPHVFVERPLHPQKVGVWAAISSRRIVGPIYFDGTITAERYRIEILTTFINELHDDELREGYFQQDGATPHVTRENLNFLSEFFENRVISRNTQQIWPPRSCDLTPCDFFLWPFIKNSIYRTPIEDINDLKRRISEKIAEINNSPNVLVNVSLRVRRNIRRCLEVGGGHIK